MANFHERELINGKPVMNSTQILESNNKKDNISPDTQNTSHNIKKEALGPNTRR